MRVILLGGSGFLGSNMALYLIKEGYEVIVADLYENKALMNIDNLSFKKIDFASYPDYTELLKKGDIVFHLISIPSKTVQEDIKNNLLSTVHLLEACTKIEIRKLIFVSSGGTVYGNQISMPLKEESNTEPLNIYGMQKLTIENYIKLYNKIFGLPVHIVRISNPYGPGQKPFKSQGVIPTIIASVLLGKEVEIWGDGDDLRDYIYIDDVIILLKKIMNLDESYLLINLGSGKGISVNDVLKIIFILTNQKAPVKYKIDKKTQIRKNVLDIGKMQRTFPDFKLTTLEIGITKMIESWDYERKTFRLKDYEYWRY